MPLNGYDIAGVNGSGIITTALTGAFTIVKASEGQTFTDPSHDSFVSQLRSKGKLVGHYHYGRPDTKDTGDAVKEADHFIAAAKARTGETMWLDFEKSETADQRVNWPEWVIAFCDRVKARTGAACGVYWSDWFINRVMENATAAQAAKIRAYPLWKAGNNNAYVTDPSAGYGSIHGWPVLTCWQWTDKQGSLGIDRDIFYGDGGQWKALGVGAPTTEDDMPLTDDDARTIWRADIIPSPDGDAANPAWQADSYLKQTYLLARDANAAVTALAAEIEALKTALSQGTTAPAATPSAAEIADELAKRLQA